MNAKKAVKLNSKIMAPLPIHSNLADDIESYFSKHGYTFEIGPSMAYDHFGNEYKTLLIEGVTEEGNAENLRVTAPSELVAVKAYEKTLLRFIGGNRHVVWRTRPELDGQGNRFHEEWRVYSRLTVYPRKQPA